MKDESIILSAFFWITAGLGWVVWVFSVLAVVVQNWIEGIDGDTFGVRSNEFKEDYCEAWVYAVDSVCMPYDLFSTSQIFSTILCSVAAVLYTVAFFRPAEAPHGSAQALGLVGGILMIITAFFQMLALLFVDMAIREWDELLSALIGDTQYSTMDEYKLSHGPTYTIGVVTFILSAINAIIIFVSYRHAGDGIVLLYVKEKRLCYSGMADITPV